MGKKFNLYFRFHVTLGYMILNSRMVDLSKMISEQQKYISNGFRNIGFALLAPFGSILFQWIVLKDGAYFEHFGFSVLSLLFGLLVLYVGYKYLEEKK